MKTVIKKVSPDGFKLEGATESELKNVLAQINRSDYAESTKDVVTNLISEIK